jgi:hypothetical protein
LRGDQAVVKGRDVQADLTGVAVVVVSRIQLVLQYQCLHGEQQEEQ